MGIPPGLDFVYAGFMEEVLALYPAEDGAHRTVGDRFQPTWEGTSWEPDLEILSVGSAGDEKRWKLNELLPMAFTPHSLLPEQPE